MLNSYVFLNIRKRHFKLSDSGEALLINDKTEIFKVTPPVIQREIECLGLVSITWISKRQQFQKQASYMIWLNSSEKIWAFTKKRLVVIFRRLLNRSNFLGPFPWFVCTYSDISLPVALGVAFCVTLASAITKVERRLSEIFAYKQQREQLQEK